MRLLDQIEIHSQRADELVRLLYSAFLSQRGLLADQSDLVERQIPANVEPLSREHACFLFYTVLNDHGLKSSAMYERAKALHNEFPVFFSPEWISENFQSGDLVRIEHDITRKLGARYPAALAKAWYENSLKLKEEYGGDPRNLFSASTKATILLRLIRSFRGFGSKIGGMLLRAIVGLGFNRNLTGLDEVLVPVDIHDSRIMFLAGIFNRRDRKPEQLFTRYVTLAQKELLAACNRCRINWLDVDRALWLVGSRGCARARCAPCPIRKLCSRPGQLSFSEIPLLSTGQ